MLERYFIFIMISYISEILSAERRSPNWIRVMVKKQTWSV